MTVKGTGQAMSVKPNTDARSYNHCCSGKAIRLTYSECVFVALGIQHAERRSRITRILSSVTRLYLQHLRTLSNTWQYFRGRGCVGNVLTVEGVF